MKIVLSFKIILFYCMGIQTSRTGGKNYQAKKCNRNAPIWPGKARSDEVEVRIW